ncbi:MAG TPA: PTS sugar transporter subunit IIC [Gemmatimonadaceae bacterium]|nr:PTS sugar transporter subunit IIC [Gemmatimonadaceae bacterium]
MDAVFLLPLALLGAVVGLDVVSFPQAMVSRPIVAATLAGAMTGSVVRGLLLGAILELFALEMLAVGASRYPEWGSASVVGGALYSSGVLASPDGGALVVAVAAALITAWLGGWSMYLHRKVNGYFARRSLPRLDRGSSGAVIGLQLTGLTLDLVRGGLLTLLVLLVSIPLGQLVARHWGLDAQTTRAVVLAVATAAAGGAAWRLFHGTGGARWWFVGGLTAGIALLLLFAAE